MPAILWLRSVTKRRGSCGAHQAGDCPDANEHDDEADAERFHREAECCFRETEFFRVD
jgi:hypothetical protein